MAYAPTPIAERFWAKVRKTETCWEWIGSTRRDGYGVLGQRVGRRWVPQSVHRLSWLIHFGPIPAGMQVCHHCDNRICVRPDHLFVGTKLDNMRDMVAKRRHWRHRPLPTRVSFRAWGA